MRGTSSRSSSAPVPRSRKWRGGSFPNLEEEIAMRNAIACSLALGAVVFLGHSAQAQLLEKKALSLEASRKMVAAAEAEAERTHWRGVVAVVDDGGWVILLERMDHAAMTASVGLRAGQGRGAGV